MSLHRKVHEQGKVFGVGEQAITQFLIYTQFHSFKIFMDHNVNWGGDGTGGWVDGMEMWY